MDVTPISAAQNAAASLKHHVVSMRGSDELLTSAASIAAASLKRHLARCHSATSMPISAAYCRGLIEAARTSQRPRCGCRVFRGEIAAASLKHDIGKPARQRDCHFRGVIAAASLKRKEIDPHAIRRTGWRRFRGLIPRPHLKHERPDQGSSGSSCDFRGFIAAASSEAL